MNMINKESWNRQARRYQQNALFSFTTIDYGDVRCPNEDELHLIGDVKGESILELGCGGANCGIALAKKGAIVTCLDISQEQLRLAKKNAAREGVSIHFIEASADELDSFAGNEFDKVISICALQYVRDIGRIFKEVNRLLKQSGKFIFSMDDPVFYSVASMVLWKEASPHDSYFYNGEEKWKWEDTDDFEFITYRRPIFEYVNGLVKAGLSIEKFLEMSPRYEKASSPEEQLEEKFPRIMVFKAGKSSSL